MKVFALILALALALPGVTLASVTIPQAKLSPAKVQQFVTPLPTFAPTTATNLGFQLPYRFAADNALGQTRTIDIIETQVKSLPDGFYAVLPAAVAVTPTLTINPKLGTWVYAYREPGHLYDNSWIGPSILAPRGWRDNVVYINKISNSIVQKYLTTDQTLAWADLLGLNCNALLPQVSLLCGAPYTLGDVATAVHFHGTESPSAYDGGPDEWFTCNDPASCPGYITKKGPAYKTNNYVYENQQEPGSFFYHDHGLGITRLNVYGGMAGGYLILDNNTNVGGSPLGVATIPSLLNPAVTLPPFPTRWIPLVIQDRMFDTNGQLLFPDAGINPEHPFWVPEFFGDIITVNGKAWPFLNVEQDQYRFTIINGSNARFYRLFFTTPGRQNAAAVAPKMWVIGTEQGYLDAPALIASLVIAPGERYDVVVDFTGFGGKNLILSNDAQSPFPNGKKVNPNYDGTILQFRVNAVASTPTSTSLATLPAGTNLRSSLIDRTPPLAANPANVVTRQMTLNEVLGKGGPLEMLLNNTKYSTQGTATGPIPGATTEKPKVGTTEVWELINLTVDAHPMHPPLVAFQVINRQAFNVAGYTALYNAAFPGVPGNPACPAGVYCPGVGPPLLYGDCAVGSTCGGNPAIPANLLIGAPILPTADEAGWKDTVKAYPGEITRILVRFTNQEGGPYSFDATSPPGYVWHCHIVDHEDNEMMRPMQVVP
jgi:FtsP/CotA-like multicopper oxidase with cupredoxin domain